METKRRFSIRRIPKIALYGGFFQGESIRQAPEAPSQHREKRRERDKKPTRWNGWAFVELRFCVQIGQGLPDAGLRVQLNHTLLRTDRSNASRRGLMRRGRSGASGARNAPWRRLRSWRRARWRAPGTRGSDGCNGPRSSGTPDSRPWAPWNPG